MARFTFKLQPVLDHRRAVEDERQRRLAVLLRQKLILETQLRDAQQDISNDKRLLADRLMGEVDVDRIRQHASHVNQVTLRARQIAVHLQSLHRQIDKARTDLLAATRDRKAIELLRKRHHERWQRDHQRREAAALDELTTQRYARSLREAIA